MSTVFFCVFYLPRFFCFFFSRNSLFLAFLDLRNLRDYVFYCSAFIGGLDIFTLVFNLNYKVNRDLYNVLVNYTLAKTSSFLTVAIDFWRFFGVQLHKLGLSHFTQFYKYTFHFLCLPFLFVSGILVLLSKGPFRSSFSRDLLQKKKSQFLFDWAVFILLSFLKDDFLMYAILGWFCCTWRNFFCHLLTLICGWEVSIILNPLKVICLSFSLAIKIFFFFLSLLFWDFTVTYLSVDFFLSFFFFIFLLIYWAYWLQIGVS